MPTYVAGIAASSALDTAGESIDINGLDISSLVGSVLNWEHNSSKSSDYVGKILSAKRIMSEKDCANAQELKFWNKCRIPFLYCMGVLFDDYQPAAKEVAAIFQFDADHPELPPTLGFSIEGSKLNKEGHVITHSIARKLTITAQPANKTCLASTVVHAEEKESQDPLSSIFKSQSVEIELFKSEEVMQKDEKDPKVKPLPQQNEGQMLGAPAPKKKPLSTPIYDPKGPHAGLKQADQSKGVIIGTAGPNKKPVYARGKIHDYNFTAQEHREAAKHHLKEAEEGAAFNDQAMVAHHSQKAALHNAAAESKEKRTKAFAAAREARRLRYKMGKSEELSKAKADNGLTIGEKVDIREIRNKPNERKDISAPVKLADSIDKQKQKSEEGSQSALNSAKKGMLEVAKIKQSGNVQRQKSLPRNKIPEPKDMSKSDNSAHVIVLHSFHSANPEEAKHDFKDEAKEQMEPNHFGKLKFEHTGNVKSSNGGNSHSLKVSGPANSLEHFKHRMSHMLNKSEGLSKALTAGGDGMAQPGKQVGGAALVKEDLEKAVTPNKTADADSTDFIASQPTSAFKPGKEYRVGKYQMKYHGSTADHHHFMHGDRTVQVRRKPPVLKSEDMDVNLEKARVDEKLSESDKKHARYERNKPINSRSVNSTVHEPVLENDGISRLGVKVRHSDAKWSTSPKDSVKNQIKRNKELPKPNIPEPKMAKSELLQRAEEEYGNWPKKEQFELFMAQRMPNLTKAEVQCIGRTMVLKKSIETENMLREIIEPMEKAEGDRAPRLPKSNPGELKPRLSHEEMMRATPKAHNSKASEHKEHAQKFPENHPSHAAHRLAARMHEQYALASSGKEYSHNYEAPAKAIHQKLSEDHKDEAAPVVPKKKEHPGGSPKKGDFKPHLSHEELSKLSPHEHERLKKIHEKHAEKFPEGSEERKGHYLASIMHNQHIIHDRMKNPTHDDWGRYKEDKENAPSYLKAAKEIHDHLTGKVIEGKKGDDKVEHNKQHTIEHKDYKVAKSEDSQSFAENNPKISEKHAMNIADQHGVSEKEFHDSKHHFSHPEGGVHTSKFMNWLGY